MSRKFIAGEDLKKGDPVRWCNETRTVMRVLTGEEKLAEALQAMLDAFDIGQKTNGGAITKARAALKEYHLKKLQDVGRPSPLAPSRGEY